MYPQYSATTTASVFDAVADRVKTMRNVPEIRWVKHFHDHAGYIEALKRSVLDHWSQFGALGTGDKLVISFHGVPKRTLELGDPYHCECQKTGRLLAECPRARRRRIRGHLSVALRPRRVVAAVHRADAAQSCCRWLLRGST